MKEKVEKAKLTRRDFLRITGGITAASTIGTSLTGFGHDVRANAKVTGNGGNREHPNVLFILVDQLRYDVFSHRGCRIIDTPHIDRLVNQGAVFEEAICSSPLCGPSRASLLSGCYAYDGTFIHRNRNPDQPSCFKKNVITFDEALDHEGYHVEYHGKWHVGDRHLECYRGDRRVYGHKMTEYHDYLSERYTKLSPNDDYGHDPYSNWHYRKWDVDDMMRTSRERGFRMTHNPMAGVLEVEDEDTMTAWTAKKTIRFLNSRPEEPFGVTCSILQPHAPLIASEAYATFVDPSTIPMPKNIDGYYPPRLLENGKPPIPDAVSADEKGLGQFMALYYGLVKELDDWVGKILDALESNGYKKNTLVIFTADHGELMGSHNSFSKMQFFEECLRVPMILRYPGKIKAGLRLDAPASGADIAPTLLDYCGVAPLRQFQGHSLRSVLEGGKSVDPYAYSDLRDQKCLRSNEWKLVITKGEPDMLFHLKTDPYEMDNLLDDASPSKEAEAIVEYFMKILREKYGS